MVLDWYIICKELSCDLTNISAVIIGLVLGIIVATLIYRKQQQISNDFQKYRQRHEELANSDIKQILYNIMTIAQRLYEIPPKKEELQQDSSFNYMLNQVHNLGEINRIHSTFIKPELSNELIGYCSFIERDGIRWLKLGDPVPYDTISEVSEDYLKRFFPGFIEEREKKEKELRDLAEKSKKQIQSNKTT